MSKTATDHDVPTTVTSDHDLESQDEAKQLWVSVSASLKNLVSVDVYNRWFASACLMEVTETEAVLAVESDMHQVWIETNHLPEVQTALSQTLEMPLKVKVVVSEVQEAPADDPVTGADDRSADPFELLTDTQTNHVGKVGQAVDQPTYGGAMHGQLSGDDQIRKKLKSAGLNPQFSFARFVVGQNNEFAQAACIAVAATKNLTYNPLFIHGGSGLGKTHLMQAIGQRLMKEDPTARVVYLTCEKFINEFIDTVRKGSLERFRRKYRRADILLIDDIQFLGGKERSQEEFFHTFNELLDLQSQVVLTSDRPASEIKNIEPRLISRFECGLTVELQPPGVETRLAILRRKMEDWDVKLSDDILTMLAERIQSNVRRLEGGLVRIATYASLGTEQITVERCEFLLKDILREEGQKRVNIDSIQKAVTHHYDLRLADMTSRRRPTNIAFPRQVAMYLSRKMTPCSLVEIGDAFGGRDHGTVIYAVRKVEQRMDCEPQVRDAVDILMSGLQRK
ncbi:MAG: chromosomal replication initiator protein DnaA [Verrucomicrobiae bacterium]|nr:chromosomal replication initiator protein DnaA [Verrucomicrobiae bacterium]NNJ43103.1 chromosomal replication initiator protein DnaA [Akkermansiaceae bacterium]